jgi:hypothetical protein
MNCCRVKLLNENRTSEEKPSAKVIDLLSFVLCPLS